MYLSDCCNETKERTVKKNQTTKFLLSGALKAPTFCSHILYIKAKPQIIFSAGISR